MGDLGLVVKFKCAIHPDRMKAIQEDLVRQKETGVIVLPPNCEALVIPTDVDIRTESEPLIRPDDPWALSNIVDRVLWGEFGNGRKRKKRLTAAGYNYVEVQNAVNKRLGCPTIHIEHVTK